MQKIKQLCAIKNIGLFFYGIILARAVAIDLQMIAPAHLDFQGRYWASKIPWFTVLAWAFLYVRRRWIIEPYWNTPSGDDIKTSMLKEFIFWIMLLIPWMLILPALIILFFAYMAFVMNTGHYLP